MYLPFQVRLMLVLIGQSFFTYSTIYAMGPEHGFIEGRLPIVLGAIIAPIFYALFMAQYDAGKVIHGLHYSRFIYRSAIMSFLPVILYIQQGDIDNLLLILLSGFSFFLVFDEFYNHFKGNDFGYIGNQAGFDRVFRILHPIVYFSLKVLLFFASLFIVLKYYL